MKSEQELTECTISEFDLLCPESLGNLFLPEVPEYSTYCSSDWDALILRVLGTKMRPGRERGGGSPKSCSHVCVELLSSSGSDTDQTHGTCLPGRWDRGHRRLVHALAVSHGLTTGRAGIEVSYEIWGLQRLTSQSRHEELCCPRGFNLDS